jgi:hypothetical protein
LVLNRPTRRSAVFATECLLLIRETPRAAMRFFCGVFRTAVARFTQVDKLATHSLSQQHSWMNASFAAR